MDIPDVDAEDAWYQWGCALCKEACLTPGEQSVLERRQTWTSLDSHEESEQNYRFFTCRLHFWIFPRVPHYSFLSFGSLLFEYPRIFQNRIIYSQRKHIHSELSLQGSPNIARAMKMAQFPPLFSKQDTFHTMHGLPRKTSIIIAHPGPETWITPDKKSDCSCPAYK